MIFGKITHRFWCSLRLQNHDIKMRPDLVGGYLKDKPRVRQTRNPKPTTQKTNFANFQTQFALKSYDDKFAFSLLSSLKYF